MRRIAIALIAAIATVTVSGGAFAAGGCCSGGTTYAVTPRTSDNTLTPDEKEAGWKLLFDGKTLSGWGCTDTNSTGWKAENGAIYYDVSGGGMLYSTGRYGSFELKIDFKVDRGTNSGIFFRWDRLGDPVQTGIEMQVLDSSRDNPPGKHSCGAIYDVLAPSENAMKPAMEWNTALIRCRDNFVSIRLNGKRVIQMDLNRWTQPHRNPDGTDNKFDTAYKDMARVGHIGLQDHDGKVWYKSIKVRELK